MVKGKIIEKLFGVYERELQEYIATESITNIGDEIISKINEINNLLSDEQQALLQDILELEHERLSVQKQEVFAYGFILGIKLYREIIDLTNKIKIAKICSLTLELEKTMCYTY